MAEYEACITEMKALQELGVKEAEVFRDLTLVIAQAQKVPQYIISDNGSHFEGEVRRIMELYYIKHHKSSTYQPETNGAIEVANKNVKNILAKMAIPYSLVYGSEVVLPIEVKIQSLRVLVETKVLAEDWIKARYEKLALIDEKQARA
ncbi:uncharacterized protein LOC142628827 [Castanea sativa]|uniref:uncharacterized protein LOC142628827 n=1 Tax=Castanea sativa TaxID=21020 RepID=UPI003F64F248